MECNGGLFKVSGLLHRLVVTFSYMQRDCMTELRMPRVLTGLLFSFELTQKNLHIIKASGTDLTRHIHIYHDIHNAARTAADEK
jgi:hypothetical protein